MTRKSGNDEPEWVEVTARRPIMGGPWGSHDTGETFRVPADRVEQLEAAGFVTVGGGKRKRDDDGPQAQG